MDKLINMTAANKRGNAFLATYASAVPPLTACMITTTSKAITKKMSAYMRKSDQISYITLLLPESLIGTGGCRNKGTINPENMALDTTESVSNALHISQSNGPPPTVSQLGVVWSLVPPPVPPPVP